jgi:small-conductance mechanosensitive channel/CRP-like cAMP-binding protein
VLAHLLILADAPSATATAPSDLSLPSPFHFRAHDWRIVGDALLRGLFAATAVLTAGVIILVLLRKFFPRLKLSIPGAAGVLAVALYLGLILAEAQPMADAFDSLAWWLHRTFAALFVFVGIRLFDRIAIVPLLTRGGKLDMPRLLHQIVNIILIIFAVLIFGSYAFDWNINSFLAGSAVVSIVVGLALQETLSNFISGMVMQGSPPFAIGDYVVIGAYKGRVVDINWRAVTLHLNDDNRVVIPNATVSKSDLINMHAPSKVSARYLNVGVEYDVPPCDVIETLKKAALESPGVLPDPAPYPMVSDFGDNAVIYTIKFWIDQPAKFQPIEAGVRKSIWYRLKERNYAIPFPQQVQVSENVPDPRAAADRRAAALDNVPLLAPLSPGQKREIAEQARDLFLAPGQNLFQQGDPGETFYVISRGKVDVIVDAAGGPKTVATLGPGDFFGEMSALTGQPRTATIRPVEPVVLVEITKEDLQGVFTADPSVLEKISEIIARRNAEREALVQGAAAAHSAEAAAVAKQSILGRMMKFFRLLG